MSKRVEVLQFGVLVLLDFWLANGVKLTGVKRVIAIYHVPARPALAKNKIGCDIIHFDERKDVVAEIYKFAPEGINCGIDAATFR